MKLTEYGPCIRGHFAGKYKNLCSTTLSELSDLRLSHYKSTNFFVYMHMKKLLYLEFFSKGVQIRLYGPNYTRPIMSFTTKVPLGGRGRFIFEKVVTAIRSEAEKRVRNLSEISESANLLEKIGKLYLK